MKIDTNKRSIVYRSSYSLNLMAWMMSYDIKIKLCRDVNGKFYGMWEKNEHTEQLRHEYIIFEWLHKYLECFKEIKKEINELVKKPKIEIVDDKLVFHNLDLNINKTDRIISIKEKNEQ